MLGRALTMLLAAVLGLGGALVSLTAPAGASGVNETTVLSGGLNKPSCLAVDSAGDLFIANYGDNSITVVPKVTGTLFGQPVTANVPTTLQAATGLDGPYGLAFDASGNLYIANVNSNSVTVLPTSSGTVFGQPVTADAATRLSAASGLSGPYALAFDATGDLYVANFNDNAITVVPEANGSLFGQAVTADSAATLGAASGLNEPSGLAFDATGNLYVANFNDNAITVVPRASGTVFGQTVTADAAVPLAAASGLSEPIGLAFDPAGHLVVANAFGNTVSVVSPSSGSLLGVTLVKNGSTTLVPATALAAPFGVVFDGAGDLLVASGAADSVVVVSATTGTLFGQSVTAGVPVPVAAPSLAAQPYALAFDSRGDLFVANFASDTVTVLPKVTGTLFGQAVTAGVPVPLAAATGLSGPDGLAFDAAGDLFIANYTTRLVTVVPATTGTLFGQSVTADTPVTLQAANGLHGPYGLAVDPAGDLFIANFDGGTVTVVPRSSGNILGTPVVANTSSTLGALPALSEPANLAFDAAGDLFISNYSGNTVTVLPAASGTLFGQHVTADTATTLAAATGLDGPEGLAFDSAGDLLVANDNNDTVTVVPAASGTVFDQSVTADTPTALNAATGLSGPTALAFDAAGDLYVASYYGNFVSELLPAAPPGGTGVVAAAPTPTVTPPPPPFPPTLTASLSRVAGQRPEETAAAEFLAELGPSTQTPATEAGASCSDHAAAVLATSADPYDALAAAPLEGALGTGLLVTPPSASGAIDPATLHALQVGGVATLYVVGGPDAVTPAELATLRSTPAYACGGTTPTGADLRVVGVATTGADAVDTAALIDRYLADLPPGSGTSPLPSLAAAYGSSQLDQAGGNASASGPGVASGTAIVVSASDWQDAAAAAGLAYRYHLPVVLTSATSLSAGAAAELGALGVDQVLAVGGPAALGPAVVSAIEAMKVDGSPVAVLRIAGTTASSTAADLATLEGALLGWPNTTLLVAQATASGWSDALSAAALSGSNEDGLLLTAGPDVALPSSLTGALRTAGTTATGLGGGESTGIEVLGGPLAVTPTQATALQAALGGA